MLAVNEISSRGDEKPLTSAAAELQLTGALHVPDRSTGRLRSGKPKQFRGVSHHERKRAEKFDF